MPRLGACAIFRNEAPYLLEWLAYHMAVGVDRFVLYDNRSTDGGADRVRQSAFAERVTVVPWPDEPGQLSAYAHFVAHHAARFDWVAAIDLDEFLLPLDAPSVPAMLARYDGFSGVMVSWLVFGPSGWNRPPPGLVIESYHQRAAEDLPLNHHVKTIYRGADVLGVTRNSHEFDLRGPVCNTAGQAVPNTGIQPVPCHTGMVLNHYQTRSRQEWTAKLRRGSAMIVSDQPRYPPELIDHYVDVCRTEDRRIMRWIPEVQRLLRDGPPPLPEPFVFQDRSRPDAPWHAALRDRADPFAAPRLLCDRDGRPLAFPTERDAEAACDALR